MARLWSCGFELQSATSGVEWDTSTGGVSIDTTTKRSGAASFRCNPTAATKYITHQFTIDGTKNLYFRFYLRIATSTNALDTIFVVKDGWYPTNMIGIRLNSDRTLELWDEYWPVQIGSDSSALDTDTWYRIEVSYTYATNSVIAYIDGVSFATGALMVEMMATTEGAFLMLGATTTTTADLYFDDIAINDDIGTSQIGLPGEGSIVHMHPNAAGDASATTGTYADVDEVSPDDATSYIEQDSIAEVDYNFETSASAGIGSGNTITLVSIGTRQHPETAAAAGWRGLIMSQSGGTTAYGDAKTHNDTTWRTNGDVLPQVYSLTSYTDPQGGGAWTTALLDTMQAGIDVTDATPNLFISTIWALVEYAPQEPSVTINASIQSVTFSQPTATIIAIDKDAVITASIQSVTFSQPTATIVVPTNFPTVEATNYSHEATAVTSHDVSLPSGIQAGDLLLVVFGSYVVTAITTPSGWSKIGDTDAYSTYIQMAQFYKIADGEEGATVAITTAGSTKSSAVAYRITGFDSATAPEKGTAATSVNTTPNPPSVSPTWGSDDNLFIAVETNRINSAVTAYPTNYSDNQVNAVNSSSTTSSSTGICSREYAASSDDPGTFTIAASRYAVANTIVIKPSSGATSIQVSASIQEATYSQPTATITAKRSTSISASIQAFTSNLISATVSAVRNVALTAGILTVTFTGLAPEVTAETSVQNTPDVFSAQFSQPETSISAIRNISVSPTILEATFNLIAPDVSGTIGTVNITVEPNVEESTFSNISPIIKLGAGATASLQSVEFSVLSPTISVAKNILISPANERLLEEWSARLLEDEGNRILESTIAYGILVFNQPETSILVVRNTSVSPSTQAFTFSILQPSLSYNNNEVVALSVQSVIFNLVTPTISSVRNTVQDVAVQPIQITLSDVTINAVRNVVISPEAQTVLFSNPTPSLQYQDNEQVACSFQALNLSQPVATISVIRNLTYLAETQTAEFTIIQPSLSIQDSETVSISVISVSISVIAPEIITQVSPTILSDCQLFTFTPLSPVVTATKQIQFSAEKQALSFSVNQPEIVISIYTDADIQTLTISFPVPTISAYGLIPYSDKSSPYSKKDSPYSKKTTPYNRYRNS